MNPNPFCRYLFGTFGPQNISPEILTSRLERSGKSVAIFSMEDTQTSDLAIGVLTTENLPGLEAFLGAQIKTDRLAISKVGNQHRWPFLAAGGGLFLLVRFVFSAGRLRLFRRLDFNLRLGLSLFRLDFPVDHQGLESIRVYLLDFGQLLLCQDLCGPGLQMKRGPPNGSVFDRPEVNLGPRPASV